MARKDQIHPGLLHHPFLCGIGHANPSALTEAYSAGLTGVYHCAALPMAWHLLVGLHVPWPAMDYKMHRREYYIHIYKSIYIPILQGWSGCNLQSSPKTELFETMGYMLLSAGVAEKIDDV